MAAAQQPLVGPLSALRIAVHDLETARGFYRDALGLPESSAEPGWAVYEAGPVRLIIEAVEPGDDEVAVGRFVGASFAVTDAAAVCDALRARQVTIVGEPETQPWGGTLAHVADPDGNVLTLVQY